MLCLLKPATLHECRFHGQARKWKALLSPDSPLGGLTGVTFSSPADFSENFQSNGCRAPGGPVGRGLLEDRYLMAQVDAGPSCVLPPRAVPPGLHLLSLLLRKVLKGLGKMGRPGAGLPVNVVSPGPQPFSWTPQEATACPCLPGSIQKDTATPGQSSICLPMPALSSVHKQPSRECLTHVLMSLALENVPPATGLSRLGISLHSACDNSGLVKPGRQPAQPHLNSTEAGPGASLGRKKRKEGEREGE